MAAASFLKILTWLVPLLLSNMVHALPTTATERPEPVTSAVVASLITLRCQVSGAPVTKVKWLKEGLEVKGNRFQVLDNGDLQINPVYFQDEGEYVCSASSESGNVSATSRLEVKRNTRITGPPENVEVVAGESATFRCAADADPSLLWDVEWMFNGLPIHSGLDTRVVQANDASLTITKTTEEDSGEYTCVAKTQLDKADASATLTVLGTPNPPKILGVQCDGLTAAVMWEPAGDRGAPILSYAIQYSTSFTPGQWEDAFAYIPVPEREFKVPMTPWANYTFRVVALNKVGPSEPSNPSDVVCQTPQDVPYKNPDDVVGKGTYKDNLVISWTAMPLIEQNAPGFFYRAFFKREDIAEAPWQIVDRVNESSVVVLDQPTFKPYRIRVEAHNSKGPARTAAEEVIGYSGEDVPLEAPKNFRLVSVNDEDSRSAVLSWDPVSPESVRGHLKGYKIQTWTIDEGEERLREQVVNANVTRSLVTIFKPFNRNIARVLAFNGMYDGPASDVIEFLTSESTPGPVAYFNALPLDSSTVYLIWKRPLEPNGVLTGYNIYYREVLGTELGEERERTPQITDPERTGAILGGLKPDTKYRLEIRATTHRGQGEKVYLEVKTNERPEQLQPDEPDFVWSRLPDVDGKTSVRVTWVPSLDGHPGSHFFVQYRKKGESTWESSAHEEDEDYIVVRGLEPASLYEMKVVAVDGPFHTSSRVEEIETGGIS